MNTCQLIMAVVTMMVASAVTYPSRPSFIGCTSSEDCGPEECCVLGMMRYSVPTCRKLGDAGDACRPRAGESSSPQNLTVWYPDGSSAEVSAYMATCPCMSGLDCSEDTVSCTTGLDAAAGQQLLLREDYTDVDDINRLR